jgi:hypothetical protein
MTMNLPPLDVLEIRVLGSLVEKEMATPEYYPLSLNALTNACNQKSNREPVLALEETDVARALERLRHLGLAMLSAEGGRVPKYRHTLVEKLYLEKGELAILCELLLRGAQTVGELRGRSERLHPLADLAAAEGILQDLMEKEPPLAVRLPRQPGRKEPRFLHLLGGPPDLDFEAPAPAPESATLRVRAEAEAIAALEAEMATLRAEVDDLRREMAAFRAQFE